MLRNTWRAWAITWQDLGGLYWMYLRIALVAWITLGIGLVIWAELPATATGAVFIILEVIMFAQVATRLWQLSSAMTWYKGHAEMAPAPVMVYTPPPQGALGVAAAAEPAPPAPPDPGPELPPADA